MLFWVSLIDHTKERISDANCGVVAITSRNAGTVRTRTVGSSLYNMAVQTSNIISTQIYQNKDKPLYYTGNKVLLGLAAYNVILFIGAKVYYTLKNKYVPVLCCKGTDVLMKISQRDKIWDAMTREEKLNYLATTKDKGNKRYVPGALVEVMVLIKL
jgi:hypothetical protein